MEHVYDMKNNCCGCGACYNVCPTSAISMNKDNEGFLYPHINKDLCVNCKKCKEVCPIFNKNNKTDAPLKVYAARSKNEEILMKSSSGGIFTQIAAYVLKHDGLVFGASFDDEFILNHIFIDDIKNIYRLQGSKYIQSSIGDSYKKIKKFLNEGRLVLFSGTPCQNNGLKLYLKKEYDNLILIDFICHGVPSQKILQKYLDTYSGEIEHISFRDKTNGWRNFNILINTSTSVNRFSHKKDIFFRGFLSNLFLRPSCYGCLVKGYNRFSDITLGDYWGIEKYHPDFFNDKGVSVILINSKKGLSIFNNISNDIICIGSKFEYVVTSNPSVIYPPKYNKKRESFFKLIDNNSFDKVVYKLTRVSFLKKVFLKLKNKILLIFLQKNKL